MSCASTALSQQPADRALKSDTTVRLGSVRRDLTGDGSPEDLTLIGVGQSIDSLIVTFTIETRGQTLFRLELAPLTRRIGYDGRRRLRTPAEQRAYVAEYGRWFFGDSKFTAPSAFEKKWRANAPGHVDAIPSILAKSAGFGADSLRGAELWREMQRGGVTIFEFSPGGDGIFVIGWSARHLRFFRLVECC